MYFKPDAPVFDDYQPETASACQQWTFGLDSGLCVYLSFSRNKKDKQFSEHIMTVLERKGIVCHSNMNDYNSGSSTSIKHGNDQIFIPILSPNYLNNLDCLNQWEVACVRGMEIVPVLYKPVNDSTIETLPRLINFHKKYRFLSSKQRSKRHSEARLVSTITEIFQK